MKRKKFLKEGSMVYYKNFLYYLWNIDIKEAILLNNSAIKPLFFKVKIDEVKLKD